VIVSHELPLVRDVAHEFVQLQDGRIVSREAAS